jgi:hypothetical protein
MRAESNPSSVPAPVFDEAAAREALWRPRVGMAVQYFPGGDAALAEAAIVTRVHSTTSVNLCVFRDGKPPEHATHVARRVADDQTGKCWELV